MSIDKEEFMAQVSKEWHKPFTKKFKRSKVISLGIDDVWGADLVDMQEWEAQNDGYKYMLNVVDVFSRFAWSEPLKTKSAKEVLDAFKKIVSEAHKPPIRFWVDQGTEFYNSSMKAYLKKTGTVMYSTFGEHKVANVERFNRTLKTVMWKEFTRKSTRRWITMLPGLIKSYNNTVHRSLFGLTPQKAYSFDKKQETALWTKQYGDAINERGQSKPKFAIGDTVRISRSKNIFEKGYLPNWSNELFQIVSIIHDEPIRYKIKDLHGSGEVLEGSFYTEELQKVKYPDVWLVDEVLKRRTVKGTKQLFVRWLGLSKKYDSWINEADTVLLK